MQLTPTWLLTTKTSQGRVFNLPWLLWLEEWCRVVKCVMNVIRPYDLKLLIGIVMRFEGYMLINTLLWWDGDMFSDDGVGLPLLGFEVLISSDELKVLQTTS
jgi:hypothetical protein